MSNINFDKFCNTLRQLKGIDAKPEGFNEEAEIKKITGAIQAFMNPKIKAKIQGNDTGFGVSTDIADISKMAYNFIMETAENDNLYEQAFQTVPVAEGQNGWEIHTGQSGIALTLRQEGEKLDISAVSGSKTTAYLYKYGMAIGIYDEMLKFRQIAKMFDLMTEARNAYLIGKSTVYYNLIKAAVGVNITTYQGVSGDGETRRDILTFNVGTAALGNRMKTKVPNASTGQILCYANPDDEARIEAVFRARTTDMAGALGKNKEVTKRPITRLYSYQITSGSPILVWPGRKNQKAELQGLTQLTAQDILTYAYLQAYWTYFGGICADTDQFQQLTLS